jgi:hypothetical protein
MKHGLPTAGPWLLFFLPEGGFLEEERAYDSEQGRALDQGCSDDHCRTDVAGYFRLTGDCFHGAAADLADTDACAENG